MAGYLEAGWRTSLQAVVVPTPRSTFIEASLSTHGLPSPRGLFEPLGVLRRRSKSSSLFSCCNVRRESGADDVPCEWMAITSASRNRPWMAFRLCCLRIAFIYREWQLKRVADWCTWVGCIHTQRAEIHSQVRNNLPSKHQCLNVFCK